MIRLKRKKWTRVAHKASCCTGAAVARYRHAADGWEGRAREVQKFGAFAVIWQIGHEELSCVEVAAALVRLFWKGSGAPRRSKRGGCPA